MVAFPEAVEDITGGSLKVPRSEYRQSGQLPVVDQGRTLIAGYTDNTSRAFKHDGPHIIFGDHTRAMKYVDFPFAMGADGVKVLRTRDGFYPKFVYHYLCTVALPDAGYSRHFKFLKEIQVPRPPLDEQRHIAAILDHADLLRSKRRRIVADLSDLSRSIFFEMFGNPLSVRRSMRKLHTVGQVITGNTPSRANPENFGPGIEWIKSDNLGATIATEAEEHLSETGRRGARIAPAGSVLVTCIAGSPQSIGKASLVDREVAFNQQINAIVAGPEINNRFLLEQLCAAPNLVRQQSTGGMKGLVSKSSLGAINIHVPPLNEQIRFTQIVDKIDTSRALQTRAVIESDEVFTSLQSRAFRGEL
ncbi:restriction endonuclease subunit S [Mycolicibacterium sp. 050232]|uniref:restriction endonuclease subunit S n=1 Tax=Mycolicibacterium sp. 050232 TaxID=3113982 RepID=UPI002E2CAF0C|nr:restriction endonuclease subunit S [Mycolicibacterium sp. 050232]MED5813438.1 restriction endonuclease subunit S [Mycolicibacterium sp. 050232]